MTVNIKMFIGVWAALVILAIIQVLFVTQGITRNPAVFVLSVAAIQASLVTLFFQHLKDEPFTIKTMSLSGWLLVVVIIIAAVTSVLTCTPYFPQG